MTLRITTIMTAGDDAPNALDYLQTATAKDAHRVQTWTADYPLQGDAFDRLSKSKKTDPNSKMTVEQIHLLLDEEGYVSCIVAVDADEFLQTLMMIDPNGDTDIYDYLHDKSFDFGVPEDPSLQIIGVGPATKDHSGDLLIRYTTKIDEFLNEN